MNKKQETELSGASPLVQSALRTFDSYIDGMNELVSAAHAQLGAAFDKAIEVSQSAQGRLVVSGMGKSGHIGRKIAATFASTGTPAFFVHPSEASHGDLGMITPQDVVIALSWSGETVELKSLIAYSRRFRIPLIAVTGNANSALASASDVALVLPQVREACPHNLAPTTSSMLQLALGDALAVALLESRGFSKADFGMFHPGGKLGAMLKFVRDLMHDTNETPLVRTGTLMSDAIVEMSKKGYGCVGITDSRGRLVGIVTDGDLRRHMGRSLLETSVDDVMTKSPKSISPDQLASEALNFMNTAKIMALMVVEDELPVGIIRIHDILRAGVV